MEVEETKIDKIISELLAMDSKEFDKILERLLLEKRLKGEKGARRVRLVLGKKACDLCKKKENCEKLSIFPPRCEGCEVYNDMLERGCERFEFDNRIYVICDDICDKGSPKQCLYYVLGLCDS